MGQGRNYLKKRNKAKMWALGIIVLSHALPVHAKLLPLPPFRQVVEDVSIPLTLSDTQKSLSEIQPSTESVKIKILEKTSQRCRIAFDWPQGVSAAAWRKGPTLWIYFSEQSPERVSQDLDILKDTGLTEAKHFSSPAQTIYQFLLDTKAQLSFKPNKSQWILNIESDLLLGEIEPEPLILEVTEKSLKTKIRGAKSVQRWIHPDTGAVYDIVSLDQNRAYPYKRTGSLTFLKTLQGAVVALDNDAIQGRLMKEDLTFTAQPFFSFLSSPEDRRTPRRKSTPEKLFSFPTFQGEWREWSNQEQEYIHRIILVKPENRLPHRIELAKFYMATGHFSEALGTLELIAQENPTFLEDPDFMAYQGLGFTLNRQPDRAKFFLEHPQLEGEPEINLWRGTAALLDQQYHEGLELILPHMEDIKHYPLPMRETIGFLAAQASVYLKYPGDVFLNFLNRDRLSRRQKEVYDLLHVELSREAQYMTKRLDFLTLLSKSPNPKVAVEASLLILNDRDQVTVGDVKMLDDLRFIWRGDHTEIVVLRKYVQALLKMNRTLDALTIMRQINEHGKKYPEHEDNLKQAYDTLYKVFMSPLFKSSLKAIAFYKDIEELLPPDERGDRILLRLAEHFEALEMPDKALKVLTQRLENALPLYFPYEFHEALSRIYRENADYENALKEIEIILDMKELAPEREQLATYTKAQIYAMQKHIPQALSLLKTLNTPSSLILQLDLLWQQKKWDEAKEVLKELIDHSVVTKDQQAKYIFALSVVVNHKGDETELKGLRQQYEERVKKTPYESAFMVMTHLDTRGETYYREAMAELKEAQNFEGFLKELRKKLPLL